MPLRIYRSRTLSAANVIVLLVGGATFGMWFFVSLYLQQVLGYSPIKAGPRLPADDAVHRRRLDARLPGVTRVGAKPLLVAGMMPLTRRAGPVHRHLGPRHLPRRHARALAAGGDRDRTGVRAGHDLPRWPASRRRRPAWPRGWSTPRDWSVERSAWPSWRRSPPRGPAPTCTTARRRRSAHAALTGGFQLAFVVAAGFALVGGLVAAFGLPRIPSRAQAQRAARARRRPPRALAETRRAATRSRPVRMRALGPLLRHPPAPRSGAGPAERGARGRRVDAAAAAHARELRRRTRPMPRGC